MSSWKRGMATIAMVCCGAVPLSAQADSVVGRPLLTWRDGVMAGVFTIGTFAARRLDKHAEEILQQPDRQRNHFLRKAAVTFRTIVAPGSVIIGVGMYATGRIANNDRLAELGLHGTEALFIGEGVGTVMKDFFGRARPYVDSTPNPDNWQLFRGLHDGAKYQSFPSGHTVAAFAAAAAVTSETARWWPHSAWAIGTAMYGGASLVGLSRMYDNRHWASDVILGAAVGTFAGVKVVRYHHEHPGNRLDKWLLNASVNPGDLSHVSFSLIPMIR